jgi:hypothetical protein
MSGHSTCDSTEENTMLNFAAIGGVALALMASPISSQESRVAPPGNITIQMVTANGSGCPVGSTTAAITPGNQAMTVTYNNYSARVGPYPLTANARKNCQLTLLVHVPQGWTYAVSQSDYYGYASLLGGATGLEQAGYRFQNQNVAYASHPIAASGDWHFRDTAAIGALVWAPCGQQAFFIINTELRAAGGLPQTSEVTMDSTDTRISTIYNLSWRQCP